MQFFKWSCSSTWTYQDQLLTSQNFCNQLLTKKRFLSRFLLHLGTVLILLSLPAVEKLLPSCPLGLEPPWAKGCATKKGMKHHETISPTVNDMTPKIPKIQPTQSIQLNLPCNSEGFKSSTRLVSLRSMIHFCNTCVAAVPFALHSYSMSSKPCERPSASFISWASNSRSSGWSSCIYHPLPTFKTLVLAVFGMTNWWDT